MRTLNYEYDDLHRLTGEQVTSLSTNYSKVFIYDNAGNRTRQVTSGDGITGTPTSYGIVDYTYDSRDRLLTEGLQTYSYDPNGNLITKSGEASYTWDYENRLIRVLKTDGTIVKYTYDPDGNRIATTNTLPGQEPQTIRYYVDTFGSLSHVVAETDNTGNLLSCYPAMYTV
jgi:YD repeat-containing protein